MFFSLNIFLSFMLLPESTNTPCYTREHV